MNNCLEKLPVVSGKWSGKKGWALPTILIIRAPWKSSRRGGALTAPTKAFHDLRVGQGAGATDLKSFCVFRRERFTHQLI
jgi:hypothetical protein